MGKIVGISGGDFQSTDVLNQLAIEMTGKVKPNVLFIPTASNDAKGYIQVIKDYYETYGCEVQALTLCKNGDTKEKIEQHFEKADLIYVGGGDTRSMLEVWRRHGVDELILKAYEKGTVITGISAGLIFWFRYGHSDSEFFKNPESWDYIFVEGLNKFPIACCPHYNEEGRDSFDSMLKHKNCAGIALENDTAFVVDGEQISIKKARNDAKAYFFEPENGQLIKRELVEGERIDFALFEQ